MKNMVWLPFFNSLKSDNHDWDLGPFFHLIFCQDFNCVLRLNLIFLMLLHPNYETWKVWLDGTKVMSAWRGALLLIQASSFGTDTCGLGPVYSSFTFRLVFYANNTLCTIGLTLEIRLFGTWNKTTNDMVYSAGV